MKKTQCPHCLTIYVISDEQLRISQGIVRCGTCKERFQAELLGQQKVEVFDPRNVFIEPISEDNETVDHVADLLNNDERADFKLDGFETNMDSEPSIEIEEQGLNTNSPRKDKTPSTKTLHNYHDRPKIGNLPLDKESRNNWEFSIDDDPPLDESISNVKSINSDNRLKKFKDNDKDNNNYANNGNLIDEVNQLIEKKNIPPHEQRIEITDAKKSRLRSYDRLPQKPVVKSLHKDKQTRTKTAPKAVLSRAKTDSEFTLNKESKTPLRAWFYSFVLLIVGFVFAVGLMYQLWSKQAIAWPDDKRLQAKIAPILTPLKEPIETGLARFNIKIPDRRNLSQLELASARTELHPTRSSTILLRVGLINGARISQPLPWLELSLQDSNGRIISRRSLSPDDYSYNNQIRDQIGPRELRKVTIELLKFPKHATGYELKLINK